MATLFRFFFNLIFLLVVHASCLAQFKKFETELYFKRFNTREGLSQASVNSILHDSKGFMWFGTDDGLNRFDGSQFKIFRNLPGDSSSILGNTIQVMREDDDGNIWIGTSEGLNRYDRHLEKFQHYPVKGLDYYSCPDLELDRENKRLYLAAALNGVFFIDLATDKLSPFLSEKFSGLNVTKVERVKNKLFVGTMEHGLFSVDLRNGELKEITLSENKKEPAQNLTIRSLLSDGDVLWVGTEGDGLKKINTETDQVSTFSTRNSKLADDKVWSIAHSRDGKLWVGTDGGGLTILDPNNGTSINYQHSTYDDQSISSNTIRSIIVLSNGDAWLGTFNGGVSFHPNLNIKFLSFRKDPEDPYSLSHNAAITFCEFDGTLWIGTDGGGLNYLKDGKFYKFKFPRNVDDPNVIVSIHHLRKGGFLIGTYQHGLYYIKPDQQVVQYKHDPGDPNSLGSNIVWNIVEDNRGKIWLGTELGINRFDPATGLFTSYRNRPSSEPKEILSDEFVESLLIDSDQTLWCGHYGMLRSYQLNTREVKSYQGTDDKTGTLPNKQILSIQEDPKEKGVIWFCSQGSGLVRFDSKKEEFKVLDETQGLPNSLIFSLRSDKDGNIWFTNNKGLSKYDIQRSRFSVFDENYGINSAPFLDNAAYVTSEGYILFGGTNGFTAFKPAEIGFPKSGLKITVTGFQLFNNEVKIDSAILKQSIAETNHINLTYDQAKFISFDFAALQFIAPSSIRYQYMLEGFENSWHPVDNKKVSITNLFPDQYKLRLRAGYDSGLWGNESVIIIDVIPNWWMTPYAKIAAALLFLGLGYSFYRYRTYNLKIRKQVLERIIADQNREISFKNTELEAQNEELSQHNEELLTHRETISLQNQMLNEAHQQLKEINQSLEKVVQHRTEKLNETITQLNKTISELDAFLYSASHDLVSPLKSILGLVGLAKRQNTNPDSDAYFQHMEISVRKLEGVIHTLMQHSFNTKAESKKQDINLKSLVEEAINEQQFMPEWSKMKFGLDLEDAVVCTDIPRLKIILSNLISNAIKYHDPKKKTHEINLHFHLNNTSWTVEIFDNGIGIERERLNRVFDMFYRATESAKGSGLGLYIVKETVGRLGGDIHVESEPGQWTKFVAKFPVN